MRSAYPKVTVMMPAYNAARHIAESIESVLRQDFRDFELVIVDDGSDDDTFCVAANYRKDSRVRLYRNEKNHGESYTRNRILALAKGACLIPHDADDMMLQGRIRGQFAILRKHPRCGVVFGRVLLYDGETNRIAGEFRQFDTCPPKEGLVETLPPVLHHNGTMMRKECVLQAGGYDSWMPLNVDVRLIRRLFKMTAFYYQNRVGFLYRRHSESLMDRYRLKRARSIQSMLREGSTSAASGKIIFDPDGYRFLMHPHSIPLRRTIHWRLNYYEQASTCRLAGKSQPLRLTLKENGLSDEERYVEGFLKPLSRWLSRRHGLLFRGALLSKHGKGFLLVCDEKIDAGSVVKAFLDRAFHYHGSQSPILRLENGCVIGKSIIDPVIFSSDSREKYRSAKLSGLFWNPFLRTYCLNVDQYRPSLIDEECPITHLVSIRGQNSYSAIRASNKTSLRARRSFSAGAAISGFEIASSASPPRNDGAEGVSLGALRVFPMSCHEASGFLEGHIMEAQGQRRKTREAILKKLAGQIQGYVFAGPRSSIPQIVQWCEQC